MIDINEYLERLDEEEGRRNRNGKPISGSCLRRMSCAGRIMSRSAGN